MTEHPVKRRKKLIEVAIPLEAINTESLRRKQKAPKGWPTSFHKWWAQRPLAACRAVIFAQTVDDPSSRPEEFPTEEEQSEERQRLFQLIERLCLWENTNDLELLKDARKEIQETWLRACRDNKHSFTTSFDSSSPPVFLDPFAGSGSIPLSAQWMGFSVESTDLNPIAVMMNKALMDIPFRFRNARPIYSSQGSLGKLEYSKNALASDLQVVVDRLIEIFKKKASSFYPDLVVSENIIQDPLNPREDLCTLLGSQLEVSAWIWCRTVKSPSPSFSECDAPLISSYYLSSKKGNEVFLELAVENGNFRPRVLRAGNQKIDSKLLSAGTKLHGAGGAFRCIYSGDTITPEYIREQACKGGIGHRLLAIVADSGRGRIFVAGDSSHQQAAFSVPETWKPDLTVPTPCHDVDRLPMYGMPMWGDAFTKRQRHTINTLIDVIEELQAEVFKRASELMRGDSDGDSSLSEGGSGARAYSEAITIYLACILDRIIYYGSSLTTWLPKDSALRDCMPRQAVTMAWDYAESNPIGKSSGGIKTASRAIINYLLASTPEAPASCEQADARDAYNGRSSAIISTDPPYYDNISYADLSDYFYSWQRRLAGKVYPSLFSTISTPKSSELVASPYRHGGKKSAFVYFLNGMHEVIHGLSMRSHPAYPFTIYYAFKQSETNAKDGTSSTGWESFLQGLINADVEITATWPLRTEGAGRMIASGTNALSSSIVLVCQRKSTSAASISRNEFRRKLGQEMPCAVKQLEKANIAPVDVAQAAIGPGMAIFSNAKAVLNPDDSPMSVREALIEINAALDEYLSQDEGDLDADSRFALTFFESYGYEERPYGDAEGLAIARNLSVDGVAEAGILFSIAGKVRLYQRAQLPELWDPANDKRLCVWEATQHLIKRLEASGEDAAAELLLQLKHVSGHGDLAANCRALAYRLYNHCEKKKDAEEARAYNGLVIAWPELERLASSQRTETTVQASLI